METPARKLQAVSQNATSLLMLPYLREKTFNRTEKHGLTSNQREAAIYISVGNI